MNSFIVLKVIDASTKWPFSSKVCAYPNRHRYGHGSLPHLQSSFKLKIPEIPNNKIQWGSVTHQMAVPVPSISCCVSEQLKFFCKEKNALAFNQDRCCHQVLCLQLIPFHWSSKFVEADKTKKAHIWQKLTKVLLPVKPNLAESFGLFQY